MSKLDHAGGLLDTFESEVRAYMSRRPFEVRKASEPPGVVWRIYLKEPVPNWSYLVGDIVHNLRSSLDHLACALVRAGGGTVTRRTYFPIAESEVAFNQRVANDLHGATSAAIDAVRQLKPFPCGTERLWHLHGLDIVDKHREILVVGACAGDVTLRMTMPGFDGSPIELPPITLKPAERVFPVVDGAEVFASHLQEQPFKEPEFRVYVSFADDPIGGHDAVKVLREMYAATRTAWDALRPHV